MTKTNGKLFGQQTHSSQQAFSYVAGVAEKSAWLACVVVVIYSYMLAAKLATAHAAPPFLDFGELRYRFGTEARASLSLLGQPPLPVAFFLLLTLAAILGFGLVGGIELISSATSFALWFGVVFLALGLPLLITIARHDAILINLFGSRRLARGLGELK